MVKLETATSKIMVPPPNLTSSLHKPISRQPVNKDSIEALTPEKDRMVSGTFVNVEYPGQPGKVSCKLYKGMEYFSKTFIDNERASIPLSVARFINERCFSTKHTNLTDEKGNPLKGEDKQARYKFIVDYAG